MGPNSVGDTCQQTNHDSRQAKGNMADSSEVLQGLDFFGNKKSVPDECGATHLIRSIEVISEHSRFRLPNFYTIQMQANPIMLHSQELLASTPTGSGDIGF